MLITLVLLCDAQNDLHGLCCCVHQLLHLQPLACSQEDSAQLQRRGLDWDAAVTRLAAEAHTDRATGAPSKGNRRQYTAPQASLKR